MHQNSTIPLIRYIRISGVDYSGIYSIHYNAALALAVDITTALGL